RNRVRILLSSPARSPLHGRTSGSIQPLTSSLALRSAGRPVHPFVPRRTATAIPYPLRPVPRLFARVRHTALPRPPGSASDTTLRPSRGGRSGKQPRVRQPEPDSSSNQYYAERLPCTKAWPAAATKSPDQSFVDPEGKARPRGGPSDGPRRSACHRPNRSRSDRRQYAATPPPPAATPG